MNESPNEREMRRLHRLDTMQERANLRLERERQRINVRFNHARSQLLRSNIELNESQQHIIDAALDLLDEGGLNNLSLRKLAQRLDIKAPALYWHFSSKESLVDYMAEAILRTEFTDLTPRADDTRWQDWLLATCSKLRKAMQSRRDGARVVAGAHLYPAVSLMKIFEISIESLTSAGVEERRADLIVSTAVQYTFGRVIEEQSSPSIEEIKNIDTATIKDRFPYFARGIDRMVDDIYTGYDEYEDALRLIIGD